jgi:hypothetical protein
MILQAVPGTAATVGTAWQFTLRGRKGLIWVCAFDFKPCRNPSHFSLLKLTHVRVTHIRQFTGGIL